MRLGQQAGIDLDRIYTSYFASLLAADYQSSRRAVEQWLEADASILHLYVDLFQRALYDIGRLWEVGKISVASEHLATAITESMMAHLYPRLLSTALPRGSVLVACAEREHHQIGAKMVSDIFELKGWHSRYLGARCSLPVLEEAILERRADVVALSSALSTHLNSVYETAAALRAHFSTIHILVGGQAFRGGGWAQFESVEKLTYLGSLAELERWLDEY